MKTTDNTPAVLVRRQWSKFSKEICSNGAHYFLKFKQKAMPWYTKQLVFEAIVMLDMCHYNNRIVGQAENCTIVFLVGVFVIILIFFGIFAGITFV